MSFDPITFTLADVTWFAENAQRQRVGPMRVLSMAEGAKWLLEPSFAHSFARWQVAPDGFDILALARIVEPDANNGHSFRNVDVRVGAHIAPPWEEVPRLMSYLVSSNLSPDEWYREFEMVHPLRDGNGRVGALLWNAARWREKLYLGLAVSPAGGAHTHGTYPVMPEPWEHPPDFFNPAWFAQGHKLQDPS